MDITRAIAEQLDVQLKQVEATIQLLDEGATVPFIARYRKEVTGGLDDNQLRLLEEQLRYLRELDARREVILKSIHEQGLLTDALRASINAADSKTRLEDLYRPYKPKRRTKAMIAKEAGLQPLAEALFADPDLDPEQAAIPYINTDKGIDDSKAALEGARHILMEQFAEEPELVGKLRDYLWENAHIMSQVVADKVNEGQKFADYFDYSEALNKVPSHRVLALFRGRTEGILNLTIAIPNDSDESPICEGMIAQYFGLKNQGRAADDWLSTTVRWSWKVKISSHLDVELKMRLKEQAELEAIRVFGLNLKDLLLAAPAGQHATMGLDPGIRTGVKVAIVDATGKLLDTATIYPHAPRHAWDQSIAVLAALSEKYNVSLISIGNGTASRETDRLVAELCQKHKQLKLNTLMVSEAGASVYSASQAAADEFPDIDVSLRGAISIARRLQDPLAELVKIDPKSIGVGQYQHDVSQSQLARALDGIVEDCVNAVGVDVNTASVPLLTRVSGLSQGLARNIVTFRDENGAFKNRTALKKVARLGPKAFEQAAGFLRIPNGENPLDMSSVHPEAYPLVKRIAEQSGHAVKKLIGDGGLLKQLQPQQFVDDKFGLPTIKDILSELEKPGRDPRPEFKTATFKEGIETLVDLKLGMILEGVITNVTNFGAFVDIGVHQDGLVHISQLADSFVKDPHSVVKTGEIVKVKVMEVDVARKRIALSRRLTDAVPNAKDKQPTKQSFKPAKHKHQNTQSAGNTMMAQAFAKATRNK